MSSLQILRVICLYLSIHSTHSTPPLWSTSDTSLPTPLSTFVAGVHDDNIYLLGGVVDQYGVTPNSVVYHLNLTEGTNTWHSIDESPPSGTCCFDTQHKNALTMYSQAASYSQHLLYLVPYVTENSNKPSVLLIFDMESQSFRPSADYNYLLHEPLSDPCVVATDDSVYIIGGVHYTPPSSVEWKATFQIYDVANDSWSEGPSLNTARRSPGCTMMDDELYVFGGSNRESGDLNSIERLSMTDDDQSEWQLLSAGNLQKFDGELRFHSLSLFLPPNPCTF